MVLGFVLVAWNSMWHAGTDSHSSENPVGRRIAGHTDTGFGDQNCTIKRRNKKTHKMAVMYSAAILF